MKNQLRNVNINQTDQNKQTNKQRQDNKKNQQFVGGEGKIQC